MFQAHLDTLKFFERIQTAMIKDKNNEKYLMLVFEGKFSKFFLNICFPSNSFISITLPISFIYSILTFLTLLYLKA